MAEIKGLAHNGNLVEFISRNGGTINNDFIVNNDFVIDGELITPEPPLKIVTFADGTDEEIAAMLEAHYAGDIDIEDYWNLGDSRTVHMNATPSTEYKTLAYDEQDLKVVIIGFKHDDLVQSIGSNTKAAITVQTSYLPGNEYWWGVAHYPGAQTDTYLNNPIKQWFNEDFINALPNTFSSMIKTVYKESFQYCYLENQIRPYEIPTSQTEEKAFLLSADEVDTYGSKDAYGPEGFIYEYYDQLGLESGWTPITGVSDDYAPGWLRTVTDVVHGYETSSGLRIDRWGALGVIPYEGYSPSGWDGQLPIGLISLAFCL